MRLPVWPDICPGHFPSPFPMHAGIVTLNRVSDSWRMDEFIDWLPVWGWTLMSPAVHLCPSNTTWLLAAYLSSSSSSSSLSLSVCTPLLSLRQWALLKGPYWTGAHSHLQPQPGLNPPQQPAVWLGNYPGIDSPSRDHFFTSCRITKRLIISPAHLHSFLANVSASQSLYWLVDGDAGAVWKAVERGEETPFTVEIWLLKGHQVLFSSHLR